MTDSAAFLDAPRHYLAKGSSFITDATDALQRPLQLQYGTGKINEEAQRLQELRVLLLDVVRGETMMWLHLCL
jgi:hypothetical protein